ncbi:DUF6318 family protein [Nesterenkonia halobia]
MTPVSAETDLTADDDAGRRGARRLPLLGAILAGVLLLSACGGSPEEEGQAGSEEPSASASAGESADGGSGEDSPSGEGPEGSPSDPTSDSAGEGGTGGDGSSEPVPASSDGPAQNWPEPEAPEEITEKSEEGAEAALEYWWELYAYARNTGDTSSLVKMSMSTCDYCKARVEHTIGVYDQGGWWHQDEYEIKDMALVEQDDGSYKGYFILGGGTFISYSEDSPTQAEDDSSVQRWGAKFAYADGRWVAEDLSHLCTEGEDEGCDLS